MSGGARKDAACTLPHRSLLTTPAPTDRGRAGQALPRCEGRTPRPPLAALRLPGGHGAHLLARASACSPGARAAPCGIGHPGGRAGDSSLPTWKPISFRL